MDKLMKLFAKLILTVAKSAVGAASDWGLYQPKEPAILTKIVNKKSKSN